MKDNTPDPFGNPDFYYALYEKPKAGEQYNYPNSAYGVMSWWDYGHWITRIAHRLPNANPFQSGIGGLGPNGSVIPGASIFMTAQDEATASWVMDELDSRYVVIDYETAWPKYHTMITWSGKNQSDFYENWYRESNGELRWYENPDPKLSPEIQIFYPTYYQSMCARLYNFGTEAVVPNNSTWVLSYTWQTTENGERYKLLTDVANNQTPFATYEEAAAFINNHPGYVIVGTNPFVSPIPLEALEEYKPIHSSPSIVIQNGNTSLYYVEIFEYTGYKK
jgi:dolichyl-diphosphooligosaccharide--protein glycosyltransferase